MATREGVQQQSCLPIIHHRSGNALDSGKENISVISSKESCPVVHTDGVLSQWCLHMKLTLLSFPSYTRQTKDDGRLHWMEWELRLSGYLKSIKSPGAMIGVDLRGVAVVSGISAPSLSFMCFYFGVALVWYCTLKQVGGEHVLDACSWKRKLICICQKHSTAHRWSENDQRFTSKVHSWSKLKL